MARVAMKPSLLASLASTSLLLVACSGGVDVVGSPGPSTSSSSPSDPERTPSSISPSDPAQPSEKDEPTKPVQTNPPPPKKSTPQPSGGGPAATDADCDAFAATYCAKASACDAFTWTAMGSACTERIASVCKARAAAPGTGVTTASLATCGATYGSATSCYDAFATWQGEPCPVTGSLALDADCTFHEQCDTGYCTGTNDHECGKCAALPTPQNVPTAELGEACTLGGAGPQCNIGLGQWCQLAANTCTEVVFADLAEECGFVGDDLVLCKPGAVCKMGGSSGTWCIKEKSLGDACTPASGYEVCAYGMTCLEGTCAYPTAAAICK